MRRFFLSVLLIPALCLPSFGQIREISDEESTSPAPSDSVLVIVDGFVSPVRFENNAVPPLESALHVCPFLSKEDIDTLRDTWLWHTASLGKDGCGVYQPIAVDGIDLVA